jgi:AbrB family looped-hinge helix DNA binding protein
MDTISSKVTSKGQVVIPKRLREKYGIRSLTAIRWIENDQGILGSGILKSYLKEKRLEKQREDERVARTK